MAVVGHGAENLFLDDTAFVGEAKGQSELARSIVGRARYANELLTGTNIFPSEAPATPLNPDRQRGHNHSGPPFGSCFLHPVCSWSWAKADSTNVIRPRNGTTELYEDYLHDGLVRSYGPMTFWSRRYTTLPAKFGRAPYSALVLLVGAHKKSANNETLAVKLTVGDGEQVFTDTVSVTSTSVTSYLIDSAGDVANGNVPVLHMPCVGGRNTFTLTFSCAAAAADALTLDSWALCVARKRRWLNP